MSAPVAASTTTAVPRLLIVDDEAHIRSALIRALGLLGYQADGAASGAEALSLLEQLPYDLAVLDMRMPGMDGLEVVKRAHKVAPELLIIILTGHATLDSAIAAVKASQVIDYLLKPASIHEVAGAIARALSNRRQQQERERLVNLITGAVEELRQLQGLGQPYGGAISSAPGEGALTAERFLRAGRVVLDCEARQLLRADDPDTFVDLTEGETAVLHALMSRAGHVLSSGQLGQALWRRPVSEADAEGPVRSVIFRLRRKLSGAPGMPDNLIHTARGLGYYLVAPNGELRDDRPSS